MLRDLISIAVAAGGAGLVGLAVKQAGTKGWAGSLQLASIGLLLIGASAIGIVGFLAGIVLSPLAWLGVASLGVAGVLFVAGQQLEGRTPKDQRLEGRAPKGKPKAVRRTAGSQALPAGPNTRAESAPVDDDHADIEAILKKHGIQ